MATGAGTRAEPRRRGFTARYVRALGWVLAVLVVLGGLVLAHDADEPPSLRRPLDPSDVIRTGQADAPSV